MTADEYYKAGQLAEAVDAQIQAVKVAPADQGRRLFLFELLAFAGQWDRARKQIEAVRYDDPDLEAATAAYRRLLDGEEARRKVFRDGVKPQLLAEPPAHVALRLDAVGRLRENNLAEAAALLAKAQQASPALRGEVNGKPFDGLRDCDDLFAGVLEVLAQGAYFWVPLEQVELITLKAPRFPRDILWAPAHLELRGGSAVNVHLPGLYPASAEHDNNAVKLGRFTDWQAPEGGPVLGRGAHLFLVGDDALPLLEWREVKIEPPAA
jgi:type VI secretion system protein ImpE